MKLGLQEKTKVQQEALGYRELVELITDNERPSVQRLP